MRIEKTEAGRSNAGELLRYKRGKVQWEDMMDSTGPRNIVAIGIQKNTKTPMERLMRRRLKTTKTTAEPKTTMHKVQKPMQKLKPQ